MLLKMAVCHLFLWLDSIPQYICAASSLSNYLSKNTWAVSICWPPWTISLPLNDEISSVFKMISFPTHSLSETLINVLIQFSLSCLFTHSSSHVFLQHFPRTCSVPGIDLAPASSLPPVSVSQRTTHSEQKRWIGLERLRKHLHPLSIVSECRVCSAGGAARRSSKFSRPQAVSLPP